MLGRQALAVSSLNSKKAPQKVQTLEQLAMEQYLMLLQGACAGYVSLLKINSYFLDQVRDNILSTLKSQLSENLFGTMSMVLRQAMIDSVLSGKYPTKSYYSTYDPLTDSLESVDDFGTEADRATLETIRKHGKKCNSVCCTGAFIIETMLVVLVNEDVRVLKFEKPTSQIFWNRDRFLRKYVPLQIPAILAHYDKAIKDTEEIKKPRLEKFVIRDSNIISRSFAIRNSHFDVLTTYNDTSAYLEIPGFLSAAADPDNPVQYGGFSEHLMMMIGDVFRGLNRFERMTEIYLDSEACNTLLKMSNQYNRCISHELFAGIGVSCPNLKVLDLSNAIAISADSLIQLIFRHAYTVLHQFVYLPEYKLSDRDSIAQVLSCPVANIYRHDLTKYCPYCEDEWCCNGVRSGVEFADIKMPIIDDRLYKEIESKHGDLAKKYLVNVVKASDLIRAMDMPRWELVRPEGPAPWDEGFVPPPGKTPINDNGCLWYMPEEIEYRAETGTPVINKIANSLQCLKLNSDNFHPKHEIVPFLLKALPKVKTLGRVKVVKGLKMIRDIPELNGIVASHLEELDMSFGGHDICSIDTSWANDDINDLVEEFGERLSFNPSSVVDSDNENLIAELRSNFAEDVRLVAKQCPRLRSLRLSIFGETVFLRHDDLEIWQPVGSRLLALRELIIQAHTWQEVSGLLSIVGARLIKLNMMLEGRGQAVNDVQAALNESQVPKLESVLHRCPNLEHLILSFGMRSVDVTQQEMESSTTSQPLTTLKTFTVHTYMTKRALEYLWARAVNLESIRIPYTLVTADNFPHELVEFTEADVTRLLRTNKMRQLRLCCTSLTFKTIESAKLFIENLASATEISKLSIIVGLQEDHYPSEEQMFFALAQVMQAMRKFKLFCSEKSKLGQKIKWRWARTGALESLAPANLGPLQGLVDMSDDEA